MNDVPILNKNLLSVYQVLKDPGTYMVKVANTVKPQYLFEDGSKSRYLVNLRVATEKGFEECIEILSGRSSCEFDEVKHCFITGAIWERDVEDVINLPNKGENVIATFDYVDDILRCTAITLIPRKSLSEFDLDAFNQVKKLYHDLLKKL